MPLVRFRGEEWEVKKGTPVKKILKDKNIPLESVICKVGNKLVTEDYRLRDDEVLEIISAISGG